MFPSCPVYPVARDASPNSLAVRQVDTSDLPAQCQTSCQVINTMTVRTHDKLLLFAETFSSELWKQSILHLRDIHRLPASIMHELSH
jgi:hypothetical protein